MKALLLAIVGLNLALYLAQNLESSDKSELARKDQNIPELTILKQDGTINRALLQPNSSKSNDQASPAVRKRSSQKAPAKRQPLANASAKSAPRSTSRMPEQRPHMTRAKPSLAYAQQAGGKPTCISLGPFVDKDDAHELNEKLIALNVDSELKSIRERERFWVYLQGEKVSDSPRTIIAALKKKGLRYNLIQKPRKKYIIDFGWFKSSQSATHRMKQLRELGYTPKFEVKGSKGEQIWVNYSLPRGKKLPKRAKSLIYQTRKDVFLQQKNCSYHQG